MEQGAVVENNEKDLRLEVEELRKKCAELQLKLDETHVCNRCGRDSTVAPIKVRDDIMKKYFRSMLGQVPFTHTITAMGGQLSATFTLQRGDTLIARAKKDLTNPEGNHNALLMSTLTTVKVIDKTTEIERVIYKRSAEELAGAITNTEEWYENLLKSLDIVQLSFVRTAGEAFVILVGSMIDNLSSEDFYEGAGLI